MSRGESREQIAGLRALSLVLALLIWLSVVLERPGEAVYSIPLLAEHLPAGMALAEPHPARVDVTVSGPRLALIRLRFERAVCRLDLSRARPGVVTFDALEGAIRLDRDLKAVRVAPGSIVLNLKGISAGAQR